MLTGVLHDGEHIVPEEATWQMKGSTTLMMKTVQKTVRWKLENRLMTTKAKM